MKRKKRDNNPGSGLSANGAALLQAMAGAAALDGSAFASVNATEGIPKEWQARAKKAWEFYVEEGLVKNCVNSWRTFAIGEEVKVSTEDEKLNTEINEMAGRLKLSDFVKDMVLQLLVKGDAIGYKRYNKTGDDFEELLCVNPISVKVKYAEGTLVEARQTPGGEDGSSFGDEIDLAVDQLIHLKWDAPQFSQRGNSIVLPAFEPIELLRDYRRAEKAIAKRWATPFRMLKVGGAFGQKMIMPDQKMLEQIRDMVNKMDMKSGLVVPFYVAVETHGAEGQALNVEAKVKEVKEDIIVALGLSRSLVSGDGPNFATANVSMRKMKIMLGDIKGATRQILDWIFSDWLEIKGKPDVKVQYAFNDLDPSDPDDMRQILTELYDRRLISRSSVQMRFGLDPETEKKNREGEAPDIFDSKQTKPLTEMVMAGILDPEEARSRLGLKARANPESVPPEEGTDVPPGATAALAEGRICEECSHYDAEAGRCEVHNCDRAFEASACRFIILREGA